MKQPLISIIIPVYNVESYLGNCLESVFNQSYKNLEIIVINDGSTDNSGTICDTYSKRDKRFIIIHQKNKGLGPTRNIGLQIATGQYIYFLDSDDYIHPKAIELLFLSIKETNSELAIGNFKEVYNYTEPGTLSSFEVETLSTNQLLFLLFGSVPRKLKYMRDSNFIVAWNKLYKKNLIEDVLFKNMYYEDVEYSTIIILRTSKAVFVNSTLYYMTQRASSITHEPINIKTFDSIKAYLLALDKIPKDKEEIRGLCALKLFKIILNIRYRASKSSLKGEADKFISSILPNVLLTFNKNQKKSQIKKILFSLLYKFPLIYALFMNICEIIADLRLKRSI